MFNNIGELCPKFKDLPNEAKFIWLFTNEDISVLKLLGKYIIDVLHRVSYIDPFLFLVHGHLFLFDIMPFSIENCY
jgi:hypothetical protein